MDDNRQARSQLLSGGVTLAAIVLFIGTGSAALSMVLARYLTGRDGTDQTLVIVLLLNIALILFGWSRHRSLTREIVAGVMAEERASNLASRDPLTGLLNRRGLAERGTDMLARAQRRGKAVALLTIDLDRFKSINDRYGLATGDALLREVAAAVAAILPGGAPAARQDGDQFACLMLFDAAHPDTVERVVERILSRLGQPFHVDGLDLTVSAAIGIGRSDHGCGTVAALQRAALIARDAARTAGANRHAWFDLSMERELRERNELEAALRLAIPRGEIVPYFEQQVDLQTGQLKGFEVLARWEHPQRGALAPDRFIAVAEEAGLIADLSMAVMRQAFAVARDWHPALTLSINISAWQLRDTWFAQKVIKLLAETGFPAARLEIEITEAALIDNLALAQSIIVSLKNQGIGLALDDFGTGYSSLAHLRAVPFDRLKIDRSFIISIASNAESAAVANAIARLAEGLNLPVTAEGIEDGVIEERVRALGCTLGQGHHYGRPMAMADVRRLLAERCLLVQPAPPTDDATSRRRAG